MIVIYGLRDESQGGHYFYVGSTKKAPKTRLAEHFNEVRKGIHINRHLQSIIRKAGKENIKIEVLETVEDRRRYECEYGWIAKLRREGMRLCNLSLTSPEHLFLTKTAQREQETIDRWSDPELLLADLESLEAGPGLAQYAHQQDILEKFHHVAVVMLKHVLNNHWAEFISLTHLDPKCESTSLIQTKIKALPLQSSSPTAAT